MFKTDTRKKNIFETKHKTQSHYYTYYFFIKKFEMFYKLKTK